MKPDWKDAPEWAKWLALNEYGEWWWYEMEPLLFYMAGHWHAESGRKLRVSPDMVNWQDSLEAKPE